MERHSFYFKQFSVRHDRSAQKVGTDAVLLGAWTAIHDKRRILDAGTGSGVIALMLVQRNPDILADAIDISETEAELARGNVARSPWPGRIHVSVSSIQEWTSNDPYDLIVCNPPFFQSGTKPPSDERLRARHDSLMAQQDLLSAATRLLSVEGSLSVVLPVKEGNEFISRAKGSGLLLSHSCAVFSRKEKKQERWLLEFSKQAKGETKVSELVLHEAGDTRSAAYKALMHDFYLSI